ncbi:MAG: acetyl-CoA carboxylase biotin carboxyl carrier protein subunit [Akkermansia sp.]
MKKLRITVDGKAFDVSVEILDSTCCNSSPVAPVASAPVATSAPVVSAPAPAVAAPVAAGAGDVLSPLAGKVVSLDAAVGSTVKAGDQLITLEAMKMNTNIYAPCAGTVAGFKVTPGDSVQEGQILATIA